MTLANRSLIPKRVIARWTLMHVAGAEIGVPELVVLFLFGALAGAWYLLSGLLSFSRAPHYLGTMLLLGAGLAAVIGGDDALYRQVIKRIAYMRLPKRLPFRIGTQTLSSHAAAPPHPLRKLASTLGLLPPQKPDPTREATTAQAWFPVKDIRGGVLIRMDNIPVVVMQIRPVNMSLLSPPEQLRRIQGLSEAINGLTMPLQILSLARPLNLDGYLRDLESTLHEVDPARQKLLRPYLRYVAESVSAGVFQERRYYLLMAAPDPKTTAAELLQRAHEVLATITLADITAHLLTDLELTDMLHTWSNPLHAAYERSPVHSVTTVSGGKL